MASPDHTGAAIRQVYDVAKDLRELAVSAKAMHFDGMAEGFIIYASQLERAAYILRQEESKRAAEADEVTLTGAKLKDV